MLHQGVRSSSGNLDDATKKQVDSLLDEFVEQVETFRQASKLRFAIVRARQVCSIAIIVDDENVSLIGQICHGVPASRYLQESKNFSRSDLDIVARFDFGFNDYFVVIFPKKLLTQSFDERKKEVIAITQQYVNSEIERFNYMMNVVQVSPIFGAARYTVDEKLVFILMPFNTERNEIYEAVIKPKIESLGLLCKRADDIKSNTAIMQDIWKSICEARIIIADLSGFNPNVMYELGIAHTVGKDTILLCEKDDQSKFPFDLGHIRRIEYKNDISSTKSLEKNITETIGSIIQGTPLAN